MSETLLLTNYIRQKLASIDSNVLKNDIKNSRIRSKKKKKKVENRGKKAKNYRRPHQFFTTTSPTNFPPAIIHLSLLASHPPLAF